MRAGRSGLEKTDAQDNVGSENRVALHLKYNLYSPSHL